MEAGNRCWDWNVSEMINRKIVDHISDINLPYTENSRRYLLGEGIDGKTIFVTGSPMREVLERHREQIAQSDVLSRLGLEKERYILVSAHREENIDIEENFLSLMQAINHMAEVYQVPVIYSTHPRSMKFIRQRHFQFHPLVRNLTPFGFFDYNCLQMNSLVRPQRQRNPQRGKRHAGLLRGLDPHLHRAARGAGQGYGGHWGHHTAKRGAGGAAGHRHAARRRAPRHACGLSRTPT